MLKAGSFFPDLVRVGQWGTLPFCLSCAPERPSLMKWQGLLEAGTQVVHARLVWPYPLRYLAHPVMLECCRIQPLSVKY